MRTTSKVLVLVLLLAGASFTSAHAQYFGFTKSTGVTPEDESEREADLGMSGAVAYRVTPIVTIGAGLEYRRHYEPEFHIFEGDALFIGPSLSMKINRSSSLKLAWLAQVAGHATDDPRLFNLEEFSRQKAKAELSYEF